MDVAELIRRLRHEALHGITDGHVVLFRIHVGSRLLVDEFTHRLPPQRRDMQMQPYASVCAGRRGDLFGNSAFALLRST